MTTPRRLGDAEWCIFIVYTLPDTAEPRGYEPWLREVDNPFFNAIPGVHHYANWKLSPPPPGLGWTHFDVQALGAEEDLERVWFNPDLDRFRSGWITKWGYATATPTPAIGSAYLMRRMHRSGAVPAATGRLSGGMGEAQSSADLAWAVERVIHKHYALGKVERWQRPVSEDNPLGLDWIALDYGPGPLRAAPLSAPATEMAAP